jgi:hypothetical protein
MHNEAPGHAVQSRQIIVRMARQSLEDIDELVDEFLQQVVEIPAYADADADADADRVPRGMRETAERSLTSLLNAIASGPGTAIDASVSGEVGRRRADERIPLSDLMQAVRLDFRVIWMSFIDQIRPGEMSAMLIGGMDVWNVVEQHAQYVLVSYQNRLAESARALEDERRRWVETMLTTGGARADVVARVAQLLGMDSSRQFAVIVGSRAAITDSAIRSRISRARLRHYVHEAGEINIVIVQAPTTGVLDADLFEARCVVAPLVRGLRAVPHAVDLALAGLDAVGEPEGIVRTEDAWVALAASRMSEFAADLMADILGGLESIPPEEAARLVETVKTYLRTGSASETAAELFCHRNTVFNRITRFREVTGQDVTNVRHVSRVELALEARRHAEGQ